MRCRLFTSLLFAILVPSVLAQSLLVSDEERRETPTAKVGVCQEAGKGRRKLLDQTAVEGLLLVAIGKFKEEVRVRSDPVEVPLDRYIGDWALQYCVTRAEVQAQISTWIKAAEATPHDSLRLALARFGEGNLQAAAALAAETATQKMRTEDTVDEETSAREALHAYRLAGDILYGAHRFEEALKLYRMALGERSSVLSHLTWAALQYDIGTASRKLGMSTQGEAALRYLEASLAA